jgi:hypothetical protein
MYHMHSWILGKSNQDKRWKELIAIAEKDEFMKLPESLNDAKYPT